MRRISLAWIAAVSTLAFTQVVLAADMPVKARIAPAAAPFSWAGFYVGGNVGYSWGDWDASSNQEVYNFESRTDSPNGDGVIGGLQFGYNFQSGQWVYGIETDIQWSGERRTHSWTDPGSVCNVDQDFIPPECDGGLGSLSSEWKLRCGTLRGRAGILIAPAWLAYITGGLAYGEAEYNFHFSQPGFGTNYTLTNSVTNAGWTLGGGVETRVADRWTVKVEYLYIDLGSQTINTVDNDGHPFTIENKIRDNIVRAGLNYKLN